MRFLFSGTLIDKYCVLVLELIQEIFNESTSQCCPAEKVLKRYCNTMSHNLCRERCQKVCSTAFTRNDTEPWGSMCKSLLLINYFLPDPTGNYGSEGHRRRKPDWGSGFVCGVRQSKGPNLLSGCIHRNSHLQPKDPTNHDSNQTFLGNLRRCDASKLRITFCNRACTSMPAPMRA